MWKVLSGHVSNRQQGMRILSGAGGGGENAQVEHG